eukprot:g23282.t1
MKMSLVSNELRLKFLRSFGVLPGLDLPEAYKEAVKESETPAPEAPSVGTLEEPNEIEDETWETFVRDIDVSAECNDSDGLHGLNFWSYQRPPRVATPVQADSSPRKARARSDPPRQTVRGGSCSPAQGRTARETSRQRATPADQASCPLTELPNRDWEYMMENRAGQACTAATNGNVILMAGSQSYALTTPNLLWPQPALGEMEAPLAPVPGEPLRVFCCKTPCFAKSSRWLEREGP